MSATTPPPSRFQLIRRLAAGGMGEVLLAHFEGDERMSVSAGLVVIKRSIPGQEQKKDQKQMLEEEGRVGLRLRHANLVETFSLESYGEEPILVIEYLAGKSMAQVLSAAKKKRQPVPLPVALKIVRDAACGLHFAHTLQIGGEKLGLVHRDISPANVFVTFDGRAKVIDFGVAKAKDSEIRTSTGILKGKAGYMSPEQVIGQDLDARSDIWALGVFFWELLLAERLFASPNPAQTLDKILHMDIALPSTRRPEVPRALDQLCARMLERNRETRFASCAELVTEIDAIARSANEVQLQQFALERFPEEGQQGLEEARKAARTVGKEAPPSGLIEGSFGDWNEKTIDQPVMSVVYQRANLVGTFETSQQAAPAAEEANTVPVPHLIFSSEAELGPPEAEKRLEWTEASNTANAASAPSEPAAVATLYPAESALDDALARTRTDVSPRADRTISPPPPPLPSSAPLRLFDIGLLSFGVFALVMGLALAMIAQQLVQDREIVLYRYQVADGTDVVVALAQDAPLGVTPTPFVLRDSTFRTASNPNTPTPVAASTLRTLVDNSGVLRRAHLPTSSRARVSSMLPFLISILGALSWVIGGPAVLRLPSRTKRATQLVGLLLVTGLFGWGLRHGWLSWPGTIELEEAVDIPRLEFKNLQL